MAGIGPILTVVAKGVGWAFERWSTWRKPVNGVARRVIKLFEEHGVSVTQIPQFFPHLTLDKLGSPEALVPALNDEFISQITALFGVNRAWIEGASKEIYPWRTCYKQPARLFDDLRQFDVDLQSFPLRALYCSRGFDGETEEFQPICLLLLEKLRDLGDSEVFRFRVYRDSWDWSHDLARLQLKAMVRVYYEQTGMPVPLHRVTEAEIKQFWRGERVPAKWVNGCLLTEPSLEDFTLARTESGKSVEEEELPAVAAYIEQHDLAKVAESALSRFPPGNFRRLTRLTGS